MKKVIAILSAMIIVLSCLSTMIISASATDINVGSKTDTSEVPELSKELASLLLGECPFCKANIESSLNAADIDLDELENAKIICPECEQEIECGKIISNDLKRFIEETFPEYTDEQIERIYNLMFCGKCPDCGEKILEEGLTIGDSSSDENTIKIDSLECRNCGFKGSEDIALQEDVDKVANNLATAMFNLFFPGISSDVEDSLNAASKKAKVFIVSETEAKTLENVIEIVDLTDGTECSRGQIVNSYVFSYYKPDSGSSVSYVVSEEDYALLDSIWSNISDYTIAVVDNQDDTRSLYFYKSEVNTPNENTTIRDEESPISPKTGDSTALAASIVMLSSLSAIGLCALKKKNENIK